MHENKKLKLKLFTIGMSVTELAKACKFNIATLYRKINGKSPMTIEEAEAISKVLVLTDAEFMDIFFDKSIT